LLKRRVIICLLINDGVLFRTKKFVPDYRYTQSFVSDAADEVFMIDITRGGPSEASRKAMKAYGDRCYTPLTMGGHIKSLDDVKRYIDIGADKVVVGRAKFVDDPCTGFAEGNLLCDISEKYGCQAVVAAVDVAGAGGLITRDSWDPVNLAQESEWAGAGEIFLQSVERDGSLSGYDLDTLKRVVAAVKIPVVVGTSCGSAQHMREAFEAGACGAATANIHHFTESAMRGFKLALADYKNPEGGPGVRPAVRN
jgi:cyclase